MDKVSSKWKHGCVAIKTRELVHGGAKCTDGIEHCECSCPFVSFFSVTQENNCKIRVWNI